MVSVCSTPADLSALKKQTTPALSVAGRSSASTTLSASEKAGFRQLISGYRESATYLYRAADDLELLISHSA